MPPLILKAPQRILCGAFLFLLHHAGVQRVKLAESSACISMIRKQFVSKRFLDLLFNLPGFFRLNFREFTNELAMNRFIEARDFWSRHDLLLFQHMKKAL